MTFADPRRPRVPVDDDALPGAPSLDGGDEATIETTIDLDVRDDEASALDDANAGDAMFAPIETAPDEPSVLDDDDRPAPLEADASLAAGEGERWTDGSDASTDAAWDEAAAVDPAETAMDRGEEGFDETEANGDALPDLPAAHAGNGDDEADEALDVSEAESIEPLGAERPHAAPLARASVSVAFHGPGGEAVTAVAVVGDEVFAAGRVLWALAPAKRAVASVGDAEPSAVVERHGAALVGTDAGEVWAIDRDGHARALAHPGTGDASVGAIDLATIGDAVLARTRGGALFRGDGVSWVGPVVARNVRGVRSALGASPDWVALVSGSADAPEVLVTRDARTFERARTPVLAVVDAARSGDVIAIAGADGSVHVSRDAGASYAIADGAGDVERVWVANDGTVYAASFHEATDHGRLLRIGTTVEVVLDVEAEVGARHLAGPGELDGDGRIHAIAIGRGALWVASGVGVFSITGRG
jgi:hypothetical protein